MSNPVAVLSSTALNLPLSVGGRPGRGREVFRSLVQGKFHCGLRHYVRQRVLVGGFRGTGHRGSVRFCSALRIFRRNDAGEVVRPGGTAAAA